MSGRVHRLAAKLLRLHERVHYRVFRSRHTGAAPKPYVLKAYSSSAPTRIYHVNGNFAVGGSTQLIVDLIERLSDRYTQEVIVPDAPSPLPYQPVTVHAVPLTEMTRVRDLLERAPPAAVHVHYWVREGDEYVPTALWYHAIFDICARLGIPVIQNVNVPTVAHASPAVVHNVYVSRYVEDAYDKGLAPASVIYPGSDFDHFAAEADRSQPDDVIGMVYRLDHDKLDERSIEVFIETARRRPATRCLIVGGGQFLDLYKSRVAEEGLQDRFEFTGFVSYDALPELYRRLSVFVAPVHNESFGQVTPFAMSMGRTP